MDTGSISSGILVARYLKTNGYTEVRTICIIVLPLHPRKSSHAHGSEAYHPWVQGVMLNFTPGYLEPQVYHYRLLS
jgi:hypothetical protein